MRGASIPGDGLAAASCVAGSPLHLPRRRGEQLRVRCAPMEGREPVDPVLRPIGVVHADPEADVVIQARYAPVTRGVVEIDPALSPALDGLDGFDWAWLVTFLDRAVDPRDADDPAGALRPVPFLLADRGTRTGIFASRYPARPNRVGLSLVASSASARPSSNSRASTCSTALR